ncbi:MAG: sugar phosphate isomerase/epimerase family protein [Gillisia sp.]
MSLDDLLEFAAKQGFDAVDLTGYFFPEYPNVPEDDYIYHIKRKAYLLGLDISGTGVSTDFANPDQQKRDKDVQLVKDWIDVASKLGAPVVRIFAGKIPEDSHKSWEEIAENVSESIKECVAYGKTKGVMVGVQNHGEFLKTGEQTVKLVELVNSEWFGVIVDTGYFLTSNPYDDMKEVMPYAINFLLKESPSPKDHSIEMNLSKVMSILKESNFRGYVPLETLSDKHSRNQKKISKKYDPYQEVPVFLENVWKAAAQKGILNHIEK